MKFIPSKNMLIAGVLGGLLAIFIANRIPQVGRLVGPKQSA